MEVEQSRAGGPPRHRLSRVAAAADPGAPRSAYDTVHCRPRTVTRLPPFPLVVVVPDLRSAHNVGSVFRTADSAGWARVVLCGFSATPEHRGVAKTALGAQDAVPWAVVPDVHEALAALRADGYTVAALERAEGAVRPDAVPAGAFPLALVVGNEVDGVASDVLARVDFVVGLPQYGTKASLNVSVAFGVAAYGLVARWQALGGDGLTGAADPPGGASR